MSNERPTRDAAGQAKKRIRLQASPDGKGQKGDLIRFLQKTVKGKQDELKSTLANIEFELVNVAGKINVHREEKNNLSKELKSTEEKIAEVESICSNMELQLDDQSECIITNFSDAIKQADQTLLQNYLRFYQVLETQRKIGTSLNEKNETLKNALEGLQEEKQKLKSQKNKLEADIATAKASLNMLKECVPQKCVVCLDNAATCAIVPCGHRSVCTGCCSRFKPGNRCPVCRKVTEDIIPIYFDCPSK